MSLQVSLLICLSLLHLCVGDQPVEEVITAKKVNLLGDWVEKDPYAKDVEEAVQFAVKDYNTYSKSKKMFKLVSVENSKAQVINNMNYKFDVVLVKTSCMKSENQDLNSCSLKKRHLKCHFRVVFNVRDGKYETKHYECKKKMDKA